MGDRALGGGNETRALRVALLADSTSVGSSAEPASPLISFMPIPFGDWSAILCCTSIDSDDIACVAVVGRFGGDFSGEENIASSGSKPFSSRRPVSLIVIPVFLCNCQHAKLQ